MASEIDWYMQTAIDLRGVTAEVEQLRQQGDRVSGKEECDRLAAILRTQLAPVREAVEWALGIERQIGMHDSIVGPNLRTIEKLAAALALLRVEGDSHAKVL